MDSIVAPKTNTESQISDCFLQHANEGSNTWSSCESSGNLSLDQAMQRLSSSDAMKAVLPRLNIDNSSIDKANKNWSRPDVAVDAPKSGETQSSVTKETNPSPEKGASSNGVDAKEAFDKENTPLIDPDFTLQDAYKWGKEKVDAATPEGISFTSLLLRPQLTKIETRAPIMEKLSLEPNVGAVFGALTLYKDTDNLLNTDSFASKVYYGFATASDVATTLGGIAANIPVLKKYAVLAESTGIIARAGMGIGSTLIEGGKNLWKAHVSATDPEQQ